ncbi:MAG: LPS export ABC transporter periplasmic protein LptC [Treponema sp.]|nr:LPS export ABC transporter periplasmic protein LptC [Treponema sp.]
MKKNLTVLMLIILAAANTACTFDYGELESSERTLPDLIMENVVYVRVRSADPIARFQAERAELYERHNTMKLQNFSFEQFGERGEEINAAGTAGLASINTDSGDILMESGVRIEIESEDIIIETNQLDWKDEQRLLSSGEEDIVNIYQQNGTSFTGIGLMVNTRRRTWDFTGFVSGIYIHEDDDEEPAESAAAVESGD